MTSTDLVPRQTVRLTTEQLQYIGSTDFVRKEIRGNLPAILACVAMGRELGIGDMVALNSINVIEGKATPSAELMVMVVRREGHSITGTFAEGSATVTGKRADTGDDMSVTWTMAMAERAGLAGKQNWRKYPEAMLWARAVSQLCRMLFADCFAGATYTPEELGAEDADDPAVYDPNDDGLFPPLDADGKTRAAGSHSATPPPGAGETPLANQPPAPSEPEATPSTAHHFGSETPDGLPLCTPAQAGLIRVKAQQAGLTDDERHELTEALTGQPSSEGVPRAMVDIVLAEIASRAAA